VIDEYTEPVQVVALSLHEERLAAANARAEAAEHKATVAAMHEQLASEDAERVRHELEELQDNTVPALESEAEDLRARIAKAIAILTEPGMWSDFAARARKALSDG
jgi:hypothetical protein